MNWTEPFLSKSKNKKKQKRFGQSEPIWYHVTQYRRSIIMMCTLNNNSKYGLNIFLANFKQHFHVTNVCLFIQIRKIYGVSILLPYKIKQAPFFCFAVYLWFYTRPNETKNQHKTVCCLTDEKWYALRIWSNQSNLPVKAIPVRRLVERSRVYALIQQHRRIPGTK